MDVLSSIVANIILPTCWHKPEITMPECIVCWHKRADTVYYHLNGSTVLGSWTVRTVDSSEGLPTAGEVVSVHADRIIWRPWSGPIDLGAAQVAYL